MMKPATHCLRDDSAEFLGLDSAAVRRVPSKILMRPLSQTGNFSRTKLDLTGNNNWTDANEYDDTRTHTNVNEILTRDTNSSSPVEATLTHNLRGDMTDDGLDYTYVYDAFGRLRFIKTRGGSPAVVAEYTYNGLGQRTGWHYDVNASGTVDSSDVWFHFVYDERWRMVATVRSASGTLDTSPKELFVNHQAGLGGYGGSSYIDAVTIIDRDMTNGWSGAADGTLEQRHYPLQNWRADVVAVSNTGGMLVEGARYSAYGVRTQFIPADFNNNGAITIDDLFLHQNAYFGNNISADVNFSGGVTIDDLFIYQSLYFTGGAVGRNALSTLGIRKGFAGYENDGVLVRFSHVRHRVYDSVLARWTRRDPIGYVDGMSLYRYGKDGPLSMADPMGLFGVQVGACLLSGGGSGIYTYLDCWVSGDKNCGRQAACAAAGGCATGLCMTTLVPLVSGIPGLGVIAGCACGVLGTLVQTGCNAAFGDPVDMQCLLASALINGLMGCLAGYADVSGLDRFKDALIMFLFGVDYGALAGLCPRVRQLLAKGSGGGAAGGPTLTGSVRLTGSVGRQDPCYTSRLFAF